MNDIKDIIIHNSSLPRWPENMNFLQKFLCLYGYHKWGPRASGSMHRFPGMKLRDQCDRCGTLR